MNHMIETNPLLERLPKHLRQFIKPQCYEDYTPENQAVWRYVMRKNVAYLGEVAHDSYIKGLQQTGISIERIPSMYGMNRILKEIGWAAVAVDGFIPPAAFMEFQAYNVLVIASDIRHLAHIAYTPAPDIIHEGAGHAPIIANPEYAEYLRRFGEIGCKAISSAKDYELYEAVRRLSILKENAESTMEEVEQAENQINDIQKSMGAPSEMAQIRNLHWWTVEYGLIGTLDAPKIYGAGLLSSIGESNWCMTDRVKKQLYTVAAAQQTFDITKPQPQLYVTPDFAHLSSVLEEFADTMALRTGGYPGVQKLIDSSALGTIELSTGLQVSGIFSRVITSGQGRVAYVQTKGATALSYRDRELIGHGTDTHVEGFGTAVGRLKGINLAIEDMSPRDLRAYDIYEGEKVRLEFEGGVAVVGKIITGTRNLQGKIVLISFSECRVTYRDEVLFEPEWGCYDMAVGASVVAAYAGAADVQSFDLMTHKTSPTTHTSTLDEVTQELHRLFQSVRAIREGDNTIFALEVVASLAQQNHPNNWLLFLEIYELLVDRTVEQDQNLKQEVFEHLQKLKLQCPEFGFLIDDGVELLHAAEV